MLDAYHFLNMSFNSLIIMNVFIIIMAYRHTMIIFYSQFVKMLNVSCDEWEALKSVAACTEFCMHAKRHKNSNARKNEIKRVLSSFLAKLTENLKNIFQFHPYP